MISVTAGVLQVLSESNVFGRRSLQALTVGEVWYLGNRKLVWFSHKHLSVLQPFYWVLTLLCKSLVLILLPTRCSAGLTPVIKHEPLNHLAVIGCGC